MTRRFVPAASLAEHVAAGWRIVYEVDGGEHPIVRPAGAVVCTPCRYPECCDCESCAPPVRR